MVEVFEIKDKDLAGRIGILTTPHGKIETPYMFPVINPRKQEVSIKNIISLGFQGLITNAWLIKKYYGEAVESIHKELGVNVPIMTDSGAYQELVYGYVDADPIDIIEYQKKINSDIAVILDKPTPVDATLTDAYNSVKVTIDRALQALKYIDSDERLWVYPIQGAPYVEALSLAIDAGLKPEIYNNYSIYAIGSPTKILEKYDYKTIVRTVAYIKSRIPPDKPVHLFGAGHPMIMPFMVALGVDLFDSASYILYARDERLIMRNGTLRLSEVDYIPCSCPICSKYTPQELREMPKNERIRLIALHNLYIVMEELRNIKQAIREGRLWELLEEKSHAHPSLYDAFLELTKYVEYIEKHDPTFKGIVHGIFLYDELSLRRPEIIRHNYRVMERYIIEKDHEVVLVPLSSKTKDLLPKIREHVLSRITDEGKVKLIYYVPFIGIVPDELIEIYPLYQYEMPEEISRPVINDLISKINNLITKHKGVKYKLIVIDEEKWSKDVAKELRDRVNDIIELSIYT